MCSDTTQENGIGEKEQIQILLAEYNSLRGEINSRVSNAFQVVGFGIAAVTILSNQGSPRENILVVLTLMMFLTWIIFRDFYKAAIRVKELELDINNRADQTLLVWESQRGGLTIPSWQLKFLLWLLWLK